MNQDSSATVNALVATAYPPTVHPDERHSLKAGSIGLVGILLLAFSSAAPLVGSLGNIPFAIAFGNGSHAPGGFVIVTVVLLLFAVGYVAMAKKLTAAGGFYSFISHGLGRPLGLAAGLSSVVGYLCVEMALLGAIGYYGTQTFQTTFHVHVPWLVTAAVTLTLATVATYFGIELSARVLGVLFLFEIASLFLIDFGILIHGGAHGISAAPLNPIGAFKGAAPGIGIFFAFWSWLGFEVVPNYAEESRNPKRMIPLATYLAVIGLGVIYTLTAWSGVIGFGINESVSQTTTQLGNSYFVLAHQFVGAWAQSSINWLVLTSSFACTLAFHQTVSRYLYAIARERVILPRALGKTHPRFRSPHIGALATAAAATTGMTAFVIFYYSSSSARKFAPTLDAAAYAEVFGWLAIACTFWVMLNQVLCSLAVIRFHRRPENRSDFHWWRTFIAPLAGAVGMGYALYLLWSNLATLGGDIIWVRAIPWVCIAWFVVSLAAAFWLRSRRPDAYTGLGRVMGETEISVEIV
jgi:amino acid transporter